MVIGGRDSRTFFPTYAKSDCRHSSRWSVVGSRFALDDIAYIQLTLICVNSVRCAPTTDYRLPTTKKARKSTITKLSCFLFGDPREIRTPDTLIRSQVLYPAELLGHMAGAEGLKPPTYGFGDRCSINCAMPLLRCAASM